jgi:hypothetical protein
MVEKARQRVADCDMCLGKYAFTWHGVGTVNRAKHGHYDGRQY